MLSVYSCIAYEHDLRLVGLAALVCVLGSWITIRLYDRAKDDVSRRRLGWLFLSGVAAGGSIWCTHFVAMIGYNAQTAVSFDPMMTGASFFVAIVGSIIGFSIAACTRNQITVASGGAFVGIAIATMHYIGMMGYQAQGTLIWDAGYVLASVILSVIVSAAALIRANRKSYFCNHYGAAGLLAVAIVSLHFTGMTAVEVLPFPEAAGAGKVQGTFALAISIGGVGLLIVGMGVSSYLIDQSVQTEASARLRQMALFDKLTGLANRAQFTDRLDSALEACAHHNTKLAYLAIGIDGFKEINDGYGHAAGDRALKALSAHLDGVLKPNEMIGRVGSDEFALFRIYETEAELLDFNERVCSAFERKTRSGDLDATLDGNIGVAVFPEDADNPERLASFAELAMYKAKSSLGTSVCRFDQSLDLVASRKRRLTADLRIAIEDVDIAIVYQIQKDISNNSTIGYEALARWSHPELGVISPGEFIPLAEETGLIVPLSHSVLRRACEDAVQWPECHKVSVNISALHFSCEDLAIVIEDILWKTGLPPERLQIEITESALIRDIGQTVQTLREIQAFGVTIAMDDFGTGYSSLATLRAFPFDLIKLDREFIREIEHSQQAREIVQAVISICKSLDVAILAEGVETEAQSDFLLESGCVAVQGYLYGRPLPMEQHRQDRTRIAS